MQYTTRSGAGSARLVALVPPLPRIRDRLESGTEPGSPPHTPSRASTAVQVLLGGVRRRTWFRTAFRYDIETGSMSTLMRTLAQAAAALESHVARAVANAAGVPHLTTK